MPTTDTAKPYRDPATPIVAKMIDRNIYGREGESLLRLYTNECIIHHSRKGLGTEEAV